MTWTRGWAVAVLVAAAGCGGGSGQGKTAQTTRDEHAGQDQFCAVCKVTGGGHVVVNGQTFQVDVQVDPDGATTGNLQVHAIPGNTLLAKLDVDTILSCTREHGVLSATFAGTIPGDGRFTATVVDAGEPNQGADSLTVNGGGTLTFTAPLSTGNFQVHELDRCDAACGEGQCLCPDDGKTCEACHPPKTPGCAAGKVWNAQTQACVPNAMP